MRLKLRNTMLDCSVPRVMGVLNITPDSFSDGGTYLDAERAVQRARQMLDEGASLLDVGGESTRPGANPVDEQQELDRVVPVIERLVRELDALVSVDTMKPGVMKAACAAGAVLINDVNALRAPGALRVAAESGAAVCLMHMQGEPRSMQRAPHYEDVVGEVQQYLQSRLSACLDAGINRESVLLDPGIGFGKSLAHNLQLMAQLQALASAGVPLLVGVSRKSLFQHLLGRNVAERLPGSLAMAALAIWQGVAIVRAHDVAATVDAVRVAHAVREARGILGT